MCLSLRQGSKKEAQKSPQAKQGTKTAPQARPQVRRIWGSQEPVLWGNHVAFLSSFLLGGLARSHDRRFWGRRKEMFWVWGWFRIVWGSWFHLCTNTLRDTLCEFCVHVLHGVVGMASARAARRRRDGLGFGGWGPKHMAPGRCVVGLRDQPCNPTSGIFWAVLGPRSSLKNCFRFKQGQNFELRVRFVEAFCGVARPREFDFRSAERSERR